MNHLGSGVTGAVLLALLLCGAGAAGAAELHLVDDRGRAVEARVSVCFQVELRSECREAAAGNQADSDRGLRLR